MAKHSLLSPSAAHRWMHCTGSALLDQQTPDESTVYAQEGTRAHALCAMRLYTEVLHRDIPADIVDEVANGADTPGEMVEAVDGYVSTVTQLFTEARTSCPDALLLVEESVDFSGYAGPESFGTADAVIIADGTMHVIDFKYGKGVEVSADHNPQMLIYALGLYDRYGLSYGIDRVVMHIYQPRIGNYSHWETNTCWLEAWAELCLEPAAKAARAGGDYKAGDWCRFCKQRHSCAVLARHVLDTAGSDIVTLTPEQISARILPNLSTVKAWVNAAEDWLVKAAMDGTKFPDWKLVEGRGRRVITRPEALRAALLADGFAEEVLLKPREMQSLTALEAIVGKKRLATLAGDAVEKMPGKPTLVPETDKRQELYNAKEIFK